LLCRTADEDGTPEGGKGLLVLGVTVGSIAYNAGIRFQDVILKINGQEVRDPSSLHGLGPDAQPGRGVPVEISRHGRVQTLSLLLADQRR